MRDKPSFELDLHVSGLQNYATRTSLIIITRREVKVLSVTFYQSINSLTMMQFKVLYICFIKLNTCYTVSFKEFSIKDIIIY